MIQIDELKPIGKFYRTHALRGELNAMLDIAPEYVEDGNPLIVDIDGIYVPFYAEGLRPKGSSSYIVKLENIDNERDASMMVNKIIYGKRDLLDDYSEDDDEWCSLEEFIGFHVIDSRLGDVGDVVGFDESTVNELLIIKDKAGKEIMVPFAEAFVNEVDEDNKLIITSLPDELLNLN